MPNFRNWPTSRRRYFNSHASINANSNKPDAMLVHATHPDGIGALEASAQNTEARAQEAFGRAVFPAGHPNRPYPATPAVLTAAHEVSVPLADKPSVSVIIEQPTGLRYRDPDALALRVGTAILGHGFTGRLMGTVRDKEGLTYNISAAVAEDSIADGSWDISASFAPALLTKGIGSTRRELDKWWKDGVTDQELAARKQGLVGGYLVGLSTTAGLANTILTNVQRGYDVGWLDGYPKAVAALTRDQVNSAIKNHLNPSVMVLVEAASVAAAAH